MNWKTAVLSIAAALLSAGPPAFAGPASLRDVLELQDERRIPPPPVARYVAGEGATFILDRSGGTPLLKFEQSPEIWVLFPSAAPRGDVIYRNDVGAPVLRATKLGGLTLFTAQRPSGAPAAVAGEADGLRLGPALGPEGLLQRLAQASFRASRAAERLIPFEANDVTPGSESLYADAAMVVAEGISRLARQAYGRTALARLRKVRLGPGRQPAVSIQGGVMQILVAPKLAMAGRPSSGRIIVEIESH